MMYDDQQPCRYTAYYTDGSVTKGHTYAEALELFNARERTQVRSIAPSTPYNTND